MEEKKIIKKDTKIIKALDKAQTKTCFHFRSQIILTIHIIGNKANRK
jgi:hypothetical protein